MREQGYRQKTFWVLDLRRPEVREQIRREAKAIAQADRESDDMAFIDAVSMWDDLPPYDAPVSDDED
jgi:hypothetical protein